MSSSLRRILYGLLALLLLAALLYRFHGSITLEGFRWRLLAVSVRRARISLLLLSIGAIYLCYAIRALRWLRFSRPLGSPTFPHVFEGTLMGFAALFILGRVAEPVRPLLIARKDRLPVSGSFGVYVLERIADASATAVIAGLALLFYPRGGFPGQAAGPMLAAARTAGTALFAGLFVVISFLVYYRLQGAGALEPRFEEWKLRKGWRGKLAGLVAGFGQGLHSIRNWADFFTALGYTAAHWILIVCIYYWVPRSFGGQFLRMSFGGAMLLFAFSMVGSAVQLPGVGGGSQLACFLVFTVVFGVEREPAAAAAIVLWLITFASVSLVGLPLLIREGWSLGALRRLAREEAQAAAAGTHVTLHSPAQRIEEPPR